MSKLTQAVINGTDIKRGGYVHVRQLSKHLHTTYGANPDCNCKDCRMSFWRRLIRSVRNGQRRAG